MAFNPNICSQVLWKVFFNIFQNLYNLLEAITTGLFFLLQTNCCSVILYEFSQFLLVILQYFFPFLPYATNSFF